MKTCNGDGCPAKGVETAAGKFCAECGDPLLQASSQPPAPPSRQAPPPLKTVAAEVVLDSYGGATLEAVKAAAAGHAAAQAEYGQRLLIGTGVAKKAAQGFQWLLKAASQGHADARWNLGNCYDTGWGVEEDIEEGVAFWRKTVDPSHAEAMFSLGKCCKAGEGGETDAEAAAQWHIHAAKQNQARACAKLADCYANSLGVEEYKAEALKRIRRKRSNATKKQRNRAILMPKMPSENVITTATSWRRTTTWPPNGTAKPLPKATQRPRLTWNGSDVPWFAHHFLMRVDFL